MRGGRTPPSWPRRSAASGWPASRSTGAASTAVPAIAGFPCRPTPSSAGASGSSRIARRSSPPAPPPRRGTATAGIPGSRSRLGGGRPCRPSRPPARGRCCWCWRATPRRRSGSRSTSGLPPPAGRRSGSSRPRASRTWRPSGTFPAERRSSSSPVACTSCPAATSSRSARPCSPPAAGRPASVAPPAASSTFRPAWKTSTAGRAGSPPRSRAAPGRMSPTRRAAGDGCARWSGRAPAGPASTSRRAALASCWRPATASLRMPPSAGSPVRASRGHRSCR
jgi:hypothetical protein